MKFKGVNYSQIDLIELIKNNTAAMSNCEPRELYVNLNISGGKVTAEVVRKDDKEIEIVLYSESN